MSSANRLQLAYISEGANYNQVPAAGTWQEIRWASETLTGTPDTIISDEVRSDRQISDMPKVGETIGGGVDIRFSAATYDEWMEALLGGTWTTDVLKVGTLERSFAFQKDFQDIAAGAFILLTGMRPNTFSLNATYREMVTGNFTFLGAGVDSGTTNFLAGGSINPSTTTPIYNASNNVTTIEIGGGAYTGCLQSITINVNNNAAPQECVGKDAPSNVIINSAEITGSMEVYFSDIGFYENILNNVENDFKFTFTDVLGNADEFFFPKAKLQGDAPQGDGGINSQVIQTVNFTALKDAVEDTSLRVTRTRV